MCVSRGHKSIEWLKQNKMVNISLPDLFTQESTTNEVITMFSSSWRTSLVGGVREAINVFKTLYFMCCLNDAFIANDPFRETVRVLISWHTRVVPRSLIGTFFSSLKDSTNFSKHPTSANSSCVVLITMGLYLHYGTLPSAGWSCWEHPSVVK